MKSEGFKDPEAENISEKIKRHYEMERMRSEAQHETSGGKLPDNVILFPRRDKK
jgi:hypothetical protein